MTTRTLRTTFGRIAARTLAPAMLLVSLTPLAAHATPALSVDAPFCGVSGVEAPGSAPLDPNRKQATVWVDTNNVVHAPADHPDNGKPYMFYQASVTQADGTVRQFTPADVVLVLRGTPGDDVMVGTRFDDAIYGNVAAQSLDGSGSGSNDVVCGDGGNDFLIGVAGTDTIYGGPGNDILSGGAGSDALDGGAGTDTLRGGAGDDRLTGGPNADSFYGSQGDDTATDYNAAQDLDTDSVEH